MRPLQEANTPVAACVAHPYSSTVQARIQLKPSCCAGPTPGKRASSIMADPHLALGSRPDCTKQLHLSDTTLRAPLALPAGTSMGLTTTACTTPPSPWMQRSRWTWGTVGSRRCPFTTCTATAWTGALWTTSCTREKVRAGRTQWFCVALVANAAMAAPEHSLPSAVQEMSRDLALLCVCLLAVHGVHSWRGMFGKHAWRATAAVRSCCAGNPYADEHGAFGDNVFRYTLLSMAACEAPLQLHIGGFRQEWLDVLPTHKWACLYFCACQPPLIPFCASELGKSLDADS